MNTISKEPFPFDIFIVPTGFSVSCSLMTKRKSNAVITPYLRHIWSKGNSRQWKQVSLNRVSSSCWTIETSSIFTWSITLIQILTKRFLKQGVSVVSINYVRPLKCSWDNSVKTHQLPATCSHSGARCCLELNNERSYQRRKCPSEDETMVSPGE